jgi:hypothetical protein
MRRALSLLLVLPLAGGCAEALDQNRPLASRRPVAPPPPTTGPTVATADLGQPQPLPGLTPPPKPFVDRRQFAAPSPFSDAPSTLLLLHESPTATVSLSEYARQPQHSVDAFHLSANLTGTALRQRFGPPAGVAGIEDPWVVYRLTFGREMWLHFADGDGPLLAADLVRGAEVGYVRQRLFPTE